jgi:hypothetical protein
LESLLELNPVGMRSSFLPAGHVVQTPPWQATRHG